MARIKLALPETFPFETEIPIRITDINYGGHLGNDSLLALLHEARVKFLANYGFTELDCGGPGLIMSDAVIVFRGEAFHGMTLKVEVTADDFSNIGCDIVYRVSDVESGKEIARAKTGIAFFDYERRKTVRIPEVFKNAFPS